jgi:hypothetical protein
LLLARGVGEVVKLEAGQQGLARRRTVQVIAADGLTARSVSRIVKARVRALTMLRGKSVGYPSPMRKAGRSRMSMALTGAGAPLSLGALTRAEAQAIARAMMRGRRRWRSWGPL